MAAIPTAVKATAMDEDGADCGVLFAVRTIVLLVYDFDLWGSDFNLRKSTDAIRLSLAEAFMEDDEPGFPDWDDAEVKSEEEEQWIKKANHEVISVLKKLEFKAGDIVMRHAVPENTFYLVEMGEFEARHLEDEIPEPSHENDSSPEAYGDVVQVYGNRFYWSNWTLGHT
ncbi:hypothetical protein PInf_026440 [Phytophthora infestans]|nr:hypothetical protein PInf_026440 [Phytophthora infestans]